ncbi:MAG: hypothetical protein NDI94_06850 [Candidatus Woesearchaeota archaeon]|nr:hypothetical protein [Candidatus Woesearchaeota archaeon]
MFGINLYQIMQINECNGDAHLPYNSAPQYQQFYADRRPGLFCGMHYFGKDEFYKFDWIMENGYLNIPHYATFSANPFFSRSPHFLFVRSPLIYTRELIADETLRKENRDTGVLIEGRSPYVSCLNYFKEPLLSVSKEEANEFALYGKADYIRNRFDYFKLIPKDDLLGIISVKDFSASVDARNIFSDITIPLLVNFFMGYQSEKESVEEFSFNASKYLCLNERFPIRANSDFIFSSIGYMLTEQLIQNLAWTILLPNQKTIRYFNRILNRDPNAIPKELAEIITPRNYLDKIQTSSIWSTEFREAILGANRITRKALTEYVFSDEVLLSEFVPSMFLS